MTAPKKSAAVPVKLMTTTQAARAVGLSTSTLLRALKAGKVKNVWLTPGGHYRVRLEDVQALYGGAT